MNKMLAILLVSSVFNAAFVFAQPIDPVEPNQILLIKNPDGQWMLFNGNNLLFPEDDKNGFKVIQIKEVGANERSDEGSFWSRFSRGGSDADLGRGAQGTHPINPGPFGSGGLTGLMMAVPSVQTAARVALGAGMIAAGVYYGDMLLQAGLVGGLAMMGVPLMTSLAVTSAVSLALPGAPSLLSRAASLAAAHLPHLGAYLLATRQVLSGGFGAVSWLASASSRLALTAAPSGVFLSSFGRVLAPASL